MRRFTAGLVVGLSLIASGAAADPRVVGPDDSILDHAVVVEDAGRTWVRDGCNLPLPLAPDADGRLRMPLLATSRLLVLDAATGKPVTSGRLQWVAAGIPDHLAEAAWSARAGRLDLGCRGGEQVVLLADGFQPAAAVLEVDARRRTVLLERRGDLDLQVRPAAAGTLWLAARTEVSVVNPFSSAARQYPVAADGSLRVADLDGAADYDGVVVVAGRAPFVGRIGNLPQHVELALEPGLGVAGRVLDGDRRPLANARVRAVGAIEALDGFHYRQEARTDAEGRFAVGGLLAGEIRVTACAAGRACSESKVTVGPGGPVEPLTFELAPGHDLRLVIRDEVGRAAAGAVVLDREAYKKHLADDDGVVVFEGVQPGTSFSLEIFGAGLRPWQGTVDTGRPEVVLRLPSGGVLEWPMLTDREIAADEVVASWSRLNAQGREVALGEALWDPELRLIRADGLAPGPHRLRVRLPGAATLVSELVELGVGQEISLPAALPDHGLAVAGRVVDGDTAQPVAGATLTCEPGSPMQFRKPHELERLPRAVTDADGLFLLDGLDPGGCRLRARAPGYAGFKRDGVEPDRAGADVGDIELDHGMAIAGRVVDRDGGPLTGVEVEITEAAAYAYFAEATVRSDHDGWFRADSLPAGRWQLTARHGGRSARATVEAAAGETATAELRIGGVRLEGEVWIGDRPAAAGHLVLTTGGARGDGIVVMVQSDADDRRFFGIDQPPVAIEVGADGRFAAAGIEPGAYEAAYTPPGAGASPVSRELVVPQTELHRCVIRYSDAGVEGTVVDPDGLPVAGAAVVVQAADGTPAATGYSDGDGRFAFVGLDPGPVRLGAIHGQFNDSEIAELELRPGDRLGPVTLELLPPDGADLSLTVRAAAGSLTGAPVYLVGADTLTGFTDGAGVASFTGVDPGRFRACAAAYGGAAGCGPELELADGDRKSVTLELGRGGWISVLLGPMERAPSFRVLTADGIDLTSMLMMVSPPVPGPEGIRLGPLRADRYAVIVSTPGGPRQGAVETREQETVVLDLR